MKRDTRKCFSFQIKETKISHEKEMLHHCDMKEEKLVTLCIWFGLLLSLKWRDPLSVNFRRCKIHKNTFSRRQKGWEKNQSQLGKSHQSCYIAKWFNAVKFSCFLKGSSRYSELLWREQKKHKWSEYRGTDFQDKQLKDVAVANATFLALARSTTTTSTSSTTTTSTSSTTSLSSTSS